MNGEEGSLHFIAQIEQNGSMPHLACWKILIG